MSNDKSWHKTLDTFLSESELSADTRVLARALASSDTKNEATNTQDIAELEQALHIEQHIDDIGLQPLPANLADKLRTIRKTDRSSNIVFGKFISHGKKLSAIAATAVVVALLTSINATTPTNQQPTLAEIKQAEQELTLALQYVSLAQTKSANKIQQALNENIQRPLTQGLLKPLNHFKESS